MVDRDSHVGFVQRASVFLETPDSVEKMSHNKNDIFANLFQFVCTFGFGRSINVAAHNIVKWALKISFLGYIPCAGYPVHR